MYTQFIPVQWQIDDIVNSVTVRDSHMAVDSMVAGCSATNVRIKWPVF